MKRMLISFLAAVVVLSGCGNTEVSKPEEPAKTVVKEKPKPTGPSAEELLAEVKRKEASGDREGMNESYRKLRNKFGMQTPETKEAYDLVVAYDAKMLEESRERMEEEAAAQAEADAKRAAVLKTLRAEKDEVTGMSFYFPKSAPVYADDNALFLYFGIAEDGRPTALRLRIQYTGERWLFIDEYTFRIDETTATITPVYGDITRDNHTEVWEYYDQPLTTDTLDIIRQASRSTKTIVRHSGKDRQFDRTLTDKEKAAMSEMLDAYLEIGGILP